THAGQCCCCSWALRCSLSASYTQKSHPITGGFKTERNGNRVRQVGAGDGDVEWYAGACCYSLTYSRMVVERATGLPPPRVRDRSLTGSGQAIKVQFSYPAPPSAAQRGRPTVDFSREIRYDPPHDRPVRSSIRHDPRAVDCW